MNEYLVFKYAGYYPSGGGHDFDSSWPTIVEAEARMKVIHKKEHDSAHVFVFDGKDLTYVCGSA